VTDQFANQPSSIRYYKSTKALGELSRRIDEQKFLTKMRDKFHMFQHTMQRETLLQKLERYIDRETSGIQWTHHHGIATGLREECVINNYFSHQSTDSN